MRVVRHERNDQPVVWSPHADIVEKENEFLLKLDVPGLDTSDLKICAKDGYLEVSGERKNETQEEGEENGVQYLRQETVRGSFSRRWKLPDNLDPSTISASSSKGVVEIVIPKPKPREKEVEHRVAIENKEK